jgi:hypothetical protein
MNDAEKTEWFTLPKPECEWVEVFTSDPSFDYSIEYTDESTTTSKLALRVQVPERAISVLEARR